MTFWDFMLMMILMSGLEKDPALPEKNTEVPSSEWIEEWIDEEMLCDLEEEEKEEEASLSRKTSGSVVVAGLSAIIYKEEE